MNQIYLGQRTHGFSSAARAYFNKSLKDVTLAEAAMLAGIPQNPSRRNPAVIRCAPRRVRRRCSNDCSISGVSRRSNIPRRSTKKLKVSDSPLFAVHGDYVAEIVRPIALRAIQGRNLHARLQGLYDDRQGRAKRRLRRGTAQRAGLRPAPRLSRAGRPHRTAGRPGRARRRHRRRAGQAPE